MIALRFYSGCSMDHTPSNAPSSLHIHSPITEATQTTTRFGESSKSHDFGQKQSGSCQYTVQKASDIGCYASSTLSPTMWTFLTVLLTWETGSLISRYV